MDENAWAPRLLFGLLGSAGALQLLVSRVPEAKPAGASDDGPEPAAGAKGEQVKGTKGETGVGGGFRKFQANFLAVYLLTMFADWLQVGALKLGHLPIQSNALCAPVPGDFGCCALDLPSHRVCGLHQQPSTALT